MAESALALPRKAQLITTETHMHSQQAPRRVGSDLSLEPSDQVDSAINAYGTFDPTQLISSSPPGSSHRPPLKRTGPHSTRFSSESQHQPLLPSMQPPANTVMDKISPDFIPFPGLGALFQWFRPQRSLELPLSRDAVSASFLVGCLTSFAFRKPTQVRLHNPSADGRDLSIQDCITSTGPELQP